MDSEHDGSHNGDIKVLERIGSVIGKEAVDEVGPGVGRRA